MVAAAEHAVVTGGAGFLGAHLCAALLRNGHSVCCVDNFVTGSAANVEQLRHDPRFRLVEHDVTQGLPDVGEPSLVAHLASPASPPAYLRLPIETLHAGALGTMYALALAERHDARFLLASTSEVYGDPGQHPQNETYWGHVNPVGPRSVYDEAKRYAEALTMAHHRSHGVDVGIARIFNTYGPGMRVDDGRMIPSFITRALAGAPLTVSGAGTQTRSVCYVDDTVSGLLALALARNAVTGPINIGNPTERSVREIAEAVCDAVPGEAVITFTPATPDDPQRRCPDISRARRELGWEPDTDLREGLRRTVAWFERSRRSRRESTTYRSDVLGIRARSV